MSEIVFGKHILNSLSTGMYSDPMTVYREYIQNAADSLDNAVDESLIKRQDAAIQITVDKSKRLIRIEDNGTGIKSVEVFNRLLDVANSQKDYRENKGFRGIGRLGGLGISENLYFITSFKGETVKSTIKWDGRIYRSMLSVNNKDVITALDVIMKSTGIYSENDVPTEPEKAEAHYFHVVLERVFDQFDELINYKAVEYYLATVAPVAFDGQKFLHAKGINAAYDESGHPIDHYNVFLNNRQKPIYKQYTTHFTTGHQERNKKKDYIQSIKYFEDTMPDGALMYKGWYAITNFYGSVINQYMCGIRIRKGNILIGGEQTFAKFFSSEGSVANRWFIGEVHIYNADVLPNAKRDDFERNDAYEMLRKSLNTKADEINREYRRLMSGYNSAIKKVEANLSKLQQIQDRVSNNKVQTESERDRLLKDKNEIEKKLESDKKELHKIVDKDSLDEQYKTKAQKLLGKAESAEKTIVSIENKIVNSIPRTRNDLPTSYSGKERKLYGRIIESVYEYFGDDTEQAEKLKDKILSDIKEKK